MSTLTELGLRYNTDKAFWHRYTDVYERWFFPYQASALNILEIGISHGSSLKMLKAYFENANIVGLDIHPKTEYEEDRIKCFVCDQGNRENLNRFMQESSDMFDIIIDDGSHESEHQMITLATLWKSLRPGGLYIIEDLHTSALDFSDASACNAIKKWQDIQVLNSSWLTTEERDLLQDETKNVIWWKRDILPLKCWRCMKDVPCDCKIDLMNDGNGSITSCIVKKS